MAVNERMALHTKPAEWISFEYQRRCEVNPRYSLRAYARHLGITVGRLSEIISQKRNITERLAQQFADRLEFHPHIRHQFISLVKSGKVARSRSKKPPLVSEQSGKTSFKELEADSFQLISDWYHYAILNLTETTHFNPEPKAIAQRLGITTTEVRAAITRLKRLGLLDEKDGVLRASTQCPTTSTNIPSAAIRKSHRQRLAMAIDAISNVAVDERDFSSIMFPSDASFLEEAREHIQNFRRNMMEVGRKYENSRVYNLSIQLFPISK